MNPIERLTTQQHNGCLPHLLLPQFYQLQSLTMELVEKWEYFSKIFEKNKSLF